MPDCQNDIDQDQEELKVTILGHCNFLFVLTAFLWPSLFRLKLTLRAFHKGPGPNFGGSPTLLGVCVLGKSLN